MNEKLRLEGRPSAEQLKDRNRRQRDPILRAHLHIVWQISLGELIEAVAEVVGYGQKWSNEIA